MSSNAISKATLHLLVEKIYIQQIDEETIDMRFLMKGAFQNHIDLYETLSAVHTVSHEVVGQVLINVLDTVEQMTA